MTRNKFEYISCEMLEDLGFERINGDDSEQYEINAAEIAYRHPDLDPKNLILVDYDNGCWHFAQRKYALNGIGQMRWLDELITGFGFVTGTNLLK